MAAVTTLPAAFTVGQILTSTQMNNLRGAFRVLQVVTTNKTDTFTMSSTTYADVTGLTVSITPSSNTSKILVMASVSAKGTPAAAQGAGRLMRDTTAIAVGDAAGSRTQCTFVIPAESDTVSMFSMSPIFLDSPATTSATTYKIQVRSDSVNTIYVNRSVADANTAAGLRAISTITVMEISA